MRQAAEIVGGEQQWRLKGGEGCTCCMSCRGEKGYGRWRVELDRVSSHFPCGRVDRGGAMLEAQRRGTAASVDGAHRRAMERYSAEHDKVTSGTHQVCAMTAASLSSERGSLHKGRLKRTRRLDAKRSKLLSLREKREKPQTSRRDLSQSNVEKASFPDLGLSPF